MAEFYVHTAAVEMFLGTTGYGEDTFAAPVNVACFAEETRRLVRDKDGEQVVSESTLYTFPITGPLFAPDSRVTLNGMVSRVIRKSVHDSGDLDLPDHTAVALT